MVINQAVDSDYVIVGNEILTSFYTTFQYTETGANGVLTLSLSQNSLPGSTLNGYDYIPKQLTRKTKNQLIWISITLTVLIACTVYLIVKNPKGIVAKPKSYYTIDDDLSEKTEILQKESKQSRYIGS